MFITFEGIDGCGKSTQLELLKKHLIILDKKFISLREPGTTTFAEEIRQILLHSKNEYSKISGLFLFEAARADIVEKIIFPALLDNKIVLCDRFIDSTIAYQAYGNAIDLKTVNEMNTLATQNIKPDITFYLQIDLKTFKQRNQNKEKDSFEKLGNGFFKRVIQGYDEIAEQNTQRIKLIDGSKSIYEINSQILDYLKNIL